MQLRKAERSRSFLRIAMCGPSGSGKTFSALRVAHGLGSEVAVIDSENGSSELYQGEENPDGGVFDFSVIDLSNEPGQYSVDNYVRALRMCADAGMKVVVIDSMSHAWMGPGGVLEYVDTLAAKSRSGSSYSAWRQGTPKHMELLQAILAYPGHVIATMRSKVDYVQEKNSSGRTTIRKVGLAPVQREGVDYEFTISGDLDVDTHALVITKSRCSALADRQIVKPGKDMASTLLDWLGVVPVERVKAEKTAEPAAEEAVEPAPEKKPWEEKDRKRFFAMCGEAGFNDYGELCEFLESLGRPRPSAMDEGTRMRLVKWLRSEQCVEKYGEFLDSKGGE